TNGAASSTATSGCGVRASPEKIREVRVVTTASLVEYPTITSGGAGVARAERRSTANGRRDDHRMAADTTWRTTTSHVQTSAVSSDASGGPARRPARTIVVNDAASRNSASTHARAANTVPAPTGRLS